MFVYYVNALMSRFESLKIMPLMNPVSIQPLRFGLDLTQGGSGDPKIGKPLNISGVISHIQQMNMDEQKKVSEDAQRTFHANERARVESLKAESIQLEREVVVEDTLIQASKELPIRTGVLQGLRDIAVTYLQNVPHEIYLCHFEKGDYRRFSCIKDWDDGGSYGKKLYTPSGFSVILVWGKFTKETQSKGRWFQPKRQEIPLDYSMIRVDFEDLIKVNASEDFSAESRFSFSTLKPNDTFQLRISTDVHEVYNKGIYNGFSGATTLSLPTKGQIKDSDKDKIFKGLAEAYIYPIKSDGRDTNHYLNYPFTKDKLIRYAETELNYRQRPLSDGN